LFNFSHPERHEKDRGIFRGRIKFRTHILFVPQGIGGIGKSGFNGLKAHCRQSYHNCKKRRENKKAPSQISPVGIGIEPTAHDDLSEWPSNNAGKQNTSQEFLVQQRDDF
jgi:hypothetical protein